MRTQSSVHTEKPLFNNCSNRKSIENSEKTIQHVPIQLLHALICKAKRFCHLGGLMITSEQKNMIRELDFQTKKEKNHLYTSITPINVIPQEQVFRSRWQSPNLKHTQEIVKLAMNISTDIDGSRKRNNRRLTQENRGHLLAYLAYHLIINGYMRISTSHIKQLMYKVVQSFVIKLPSHQSPISLRNQIHQIYADNYSQKVISPQKIIRTLEM
jgi:hypothetical protein